MLGGVGDVAETDEYDAVLCRLRSCNFNPLSPGEESCEFNPLTLSMAPGEPEEASCKFNSSFPGEVRGSDSGRVVGCKETVLGAREE